MKAPRSWSFLAAVPLFVVFLSCAQAANEIPGALSEAGAPAKSPAPTTSVPGAADSPEEIVGRFFAHLKTGEVEHAYAELTHGSKIAEKPEELKQLKAKTNEAIEVFGKILNYDLVETRLVGSRLRRSTYVSLGATFPLRWKFYFYKPDTTWRLIDLRVDDKLPGIFDETTEEKSSVPKP